jgi:hypothetical protein
VADHRYPIRYKVDFKPAGWSRAEIGDDGGCDKLFIISIMESPVTGRSEMVIGTDGNGQPLDDTELFKTWVMMAHRLKDSPDLSEGGRTVAKLAFGTVQREVLMKRFRS